MARCTAQTQRGTRCKQQAVKDQKTCRKHTGTGDGGGRPSKYTTALGKKIADSIREPLPATIAAMKHGVSKPTYHVWRNEIPEFRDLTDRALADVAEMFIKPIRRKIVNDGSTEQARYMLSHMFPEEFGNRSTVEHQGAGGGPLDIRVLLDRAEGEA